ncbi:MAG: adenylyl-sulfate kinase [Planctomycetota bacterium]|nr:adenylyl-sulfate kinase [Planctomycetota bacterium]MDA1180286.1 adenylyl-sulfate kinase [Planctomycetota bacterium]
MPDPTTPPVQITWHPEAISRQQRESLSQHKGCVVWFTGLSGSGKSSIANAVDQILYARNVRSYLLDGDNVRHGLNAPQQVLQSLYGESFARRFGLGFSAEDRQENIRRISAVTQLFCTAGLVTLTAFVSPYRIDRDRARSYITEAGGAGDFLEIFVDTPLAICEQRDPKGLYRQARAGTLKGMTGIDDPYEPPHTPELTLEGNSAPPQKLAQQVIDLLVHRQIIPAVQCPTA